MSDNPYQNIPSPTAIDGPSNQRYAKEKVKTPAILLIVSGVVCLLCSVLGGGSIAGLYLGMQDEIMAELEDEPADPELTPEMMQLTMNVFGWGGIAFAVMGLIAGIIAIFGGIAMINLRGWGFAFFASIVCLVPFVQGCCLISIPVGIHAMIVLSDARVKQAFS